MSPAGAETSPVGRGDLLAVARSSGIYFVAHGLMLAAGLVSLPLTTRLLSKAEYGLLSLAFATIGVVTLVAGLGMGSAATRFYHEAAAQGAARLRQHCEGLVTAAAISAAVMALILVGASTRGGGSDERAFAECLRIGSLLVVVRVISAVVQQLYRAQERAGMLAASQVATRYGTVVVALALLYLGPRLAWSVLVATILVEWIMLLLMLAGLHRRGLVARPRLPHGLLDMLRFGVPLIAAGSARFLLDSGDRFVIERMLGLEAVASYAVPCDLLNRLTQTISMPMQLAAVPVLYRVWAEAGRADASRAASQVLSYTIALLLPLAVLYSIFDEALVAIVASAKYRGAGELTPYILPGMLLDGLNFITIVGMTLQKRTLRVAVGVIVAAALNFVLNLLFVPLWGLPGAGVATGIAYTLLIVSNLSGSRQGLDLRLHLRPLLSAAVATTITVGVVALGWGLHQEGSLALLFLVSAMAVTTLLLQALFDRDVRAAVLSWQFGRTA